MKEQIEKIMIKVRDSYILKSQFQRDATLSKFHPGGFVDFYKQKSFELKQEMEKSLIGQCWVENGCAIDVITTDWIQKYAEVILKYLDEKTVLEEVEWFLFRYRKILTYENIIKIDKSSLIIDSDHLDMIFNKYQNNFKETKDDWIQRFVYPSLNLLNPIDVDNSAKEGSNRLVLLAILAAIQKTTGNNFKYEEFVSSHFGIKDYQKAKSTHQDKQGFKSTLKECDTILKK
jgi:hypothetical protein